MRESDSRDSVGHSADDVLKTSKHHDDLRSRIAAVIDREVDGFWEPLDVADAVIRELNLTSAAGVIVGCDHGDCPCEGRPE